MAFLVRIEAARLDPTGTRSADGGIGTIDQDQQRAALVAEPFPAQLGGKICIVVRH
jgi:hypothetical protein